MLVEDAIHLWFCRILCASVFGRFTYSIVVRSYRCLCRFDCHHMLLPNLCNDHFVCFQGVLTVVFSPFFRPTDDAQQSTILTLILMHSRVFRV